MSQDQDVFILEAVGDVDLLRFSSDRFTGIERLKQLDAALGKSLSERDRPKLLADFEGVRFVSSGLLGLLAAISVRIHKRMGGVCVCCLDENLDELFRRVNLHKLLQLHTTRAEALAALV